MTMSADDLRIAKEILSGQVYVPTDDEIEADLDRRHIIVGAIVKDPKGKIAVVEERGRMRKPHSKVPDQREDYYVAVRRQSGKSGRTKRFLVRHDMALYFAVIGHADEI